jgi:hypothetical protein
VCLLSRGWKKFQGRVSPRCNVLEVINKIFLYQKKHVNDITILSAWIILVLILLCCGYKVEDNLAASVVETCLANSTRSAQLLCLHIAMSCPYLLHL